MVEKAPLEKMGNQFSTPFSESLQSGVVFNRQGGWVRKRWLGLQTARPQEGSQEKQSISQSPAALSHYFVLFPHRFPDTPAASLWQNHELIN